MWLIRGHLVISFCFLHFRFGAGGLTVTPGPGLTSANVDVEAEEEFVTSSGTGCPRSCECKWKRGKETVGCMNTGFTSLPKLIDPGTQILDFPGNQLLHLQNDLFHHNNLLNLQEILISRCRISQVDHFAFRELINLVKLDLSDNVINSVPSNSFEVIPQLRELDLSGNRIERVHGFAFSSLINLVKLEMSDCRLKAIDVNGFVGLEKLLWLKLDGNALSTLQPEVFMPIRTLHGIALHGNPWVCTCDLMPLRRWMMSNNMPLSVPPVCKEPKRINNEPWDKLKIEDFACLPVILKAATDYPPSQKKQDSEEGPASGAISQPKNVTLTCRVEANPPPKVDWLWQGHPIKNNSLSGIGSAVFIIREAGREMKVSNLTILNAEVDHGGDYVCSASNKAGETVATVQMMLAKPVTTTLQQVERSQIYVMAAFGGGAFVFVSLFFACCVFSIQHKQPMLRQGVCTPKRTNIDAKDSSELVPLNEIPATDLTDSKDTDSNMSIQCGFQKTQSQVYAFSRYKNSDNVPDLKLGVLTDDLSRKDPHPSSADEGYKSLSLTSSASVVSTTSISPEVRDLTQTVTPSGIYHDQPLIDNLPPYLDKRMTRHRMDKRATDSESVSSPRVRFNLKPIHFPTEMNDFSTQKFRERSPSDPLVSFSNYLTEDRSDRRVRFRSSSMESNENIFLLSDKETLSNLVPHTCSKSGSRSTLPSTFRLGDYSPSESLLGEDRAAGGSAYSADKSRRRQFRHQESRSSRDPTLSKVRTLPPVASNFTQRTREDVVISPMSPPISYNVTEDSSRWKFDEKRARAIDIDKMDSFLREYKCLQDELTRMKEACENLRRSNLRGDLQDLKTSIFDLTLQKSGRMSAAPKRRETKSDYVAPKTVYHQSDSANLRPILKHRSHQRRANVSDGESEEYRQESESLLTTPSSGSSSFSSQKQFPRSDQDTNSKYNSLGGYGRPSSSSSHRKF